MRRGYGAPRCGCVMFETSRQGTIDGILSGGIRIRRSAPPTWCSKVEFCRRAHLPTSADSWRRANRRCHCLGMSACLQMDGVCRPEIVQPDHSFACSRSLSHRLQFWFGIGSCSFSRWRRKSRTLRRSSDSRRLGDLDGLPGTRICSLWTTAMGPRLVRASHNSFDREMADTRPKECQRVFPQMSRASSGPAAAETGTALSRFVAPGPRQTVWCAP